MSCRSTAFSSALTTLVQVKYKSYLPPEMVLKIFHKIKSSEANPWAYYSESSYREILQKKTIEVSGMSKNRISDTQRRTILNRLERAYDDGLPKDRAQLNALDTLDKETNRTIKGIKQFTKEIAYQMEADPDELYNHFIDLASNRPARLTISKDDIGDLRRKAWDYRILREDGFLYAIERILAEKEAYRRKVIRSTPPRITVQPVDSSEENKTLDEKLTLTHFGYDPRNLRLEVVLLDNSTGKSKNYAYTRFSPYAFEEFLDSQNKALYWYKNIRGNVFHAYTSAFHAKDAGCAPKCTSCGQFATVGHGCPSRVEPIVLNQEGFISEFMETRTGKSDARIKVPKGKVLSDALMVGAVKVENVTGRIKGNGHILNRLHGSIAMYLDEDDKVRVNVSQLACSCELYTEAGRCAHLEIVGDIYLKETSDAISALSKASVTEKIRLVAKATKRIEDEQEAKRQRIFDTDWTRKEKTLREAKKSWQGESEVLYSNDFAKFDEVYRKAVRERKAKGSASIPYMKSNVLDGMATRQSGQGFGVELEYEFPDTMSGKQQNAANVKIGRMLFEAGLTRDADQMDYHHASQNGYVDTHKDAKGFGTWTFENDGSVDGGEIVSPIMYDEPETWDNLEKVLDIIKSCGGIPTKNAGSHVHVSTKIYEKSVKRYTELNRLATQHEDVLYRLATDPNRGTHRGTEYAEPNRELPPAGFKDIMEIKRSAKRYSALNFSSVKGGESDNVEFRLFDATLDPGAIQGQIKIAVAMTHAAKRINRKGGSKREKEALGAHYDRNKFLKSHDQSQSLEEETTTFRSLLDTLFLRVEDKNQIITIFANTKWGKKDSDY